MKFCQTAVTDFPEMNVREDGRALENCGGEGMFDFAAEGRRGRGGRGLVLSSAAMVEQGDGRGFAPQSLEKAERAGNWNHGIHGCPIGFEKGGAGFWQGSLANHSNANEDVYKRQEMWS